VLYSDASSNPYTITSCVAGLHPQFVTLWSRRRGLGPYVQFTDSDESLDPNWHPEQIEIMDRQTNFKVSFWHIAVRCIQLRTLVHDTYSYVTQLQYTGGLVMSSFGSVLEKQLPQGQTTLDKALQRS
jgi:hypothetical protein